MINKKQFGALAATTKTGKPNLKQVQMSGGLKSESHSYDHNRPKRQVVSRYSGR